MTDDRTEVAGISLKDPRWDERGKVHDWRNHVGNETRTIWATLATHQKVAIATDAERRAENEEWD